MYQGGWDEAWVAMVEVIVVVVVAVMMGVIVGGEGGEAPVVIGNAYQGIASGKTTHGTGLRRNVANGPSSRNGRGMGGSLAGGRRGRRNYSPVTWSHRHGSHRQHRSYHEPILAMGVQIHPAMQNRKTTYKSAQPKRRFKLARGSGGQNWQWRS